MTVLLVSANPLFREILAAGLRHADVGLVQAEPAHAEDGIQRELPDVVLLDSTLPPVTLARLLYLTTSLHCSRVILVDPACNEMKLLDLRGTTVASVADLINAVRAGIKDSDVT